MGKVRRICIVTDLSNHPFKMFADQMPKLAKGFIRLGHDVRIFSYCDALSQISLFKSKTLTSFLYKPRVDKLLADQLRHYQPDIVHISFASALNADTIRLARQTVPNAVFIGMDGDPWPKRQKNRIETAKELDILMATNDGQWLQDYRDTGIPLCVFMPNMCDPDIDRRYEVEDRWRSELLWIGKLEHSADPSYTFRKELITELNKRDNAKVYGCLGHPKIGGLDVLYAISGARIGISINACKDVPFAHSNRLTRLLAGGTFVLSNRFPNCEALYKDDEHLKYFETIEGFFELAKWYLDHEQDRKRIADTGMKWTHEQFNGTKVAGYILELVEKGKYSAPWFEFLSTAQPDQVSVGNSSL